MFNMVLLMTGGSISAGSNLSTSSELKTMDYSYQGQPFVFVPAKAGIDTTTMDYSYQGQPFVTNPYA